mgnify:CR=1 FL=1
MSVDKKLKYDMQGGVRNYLGKQKEVKAPLKWQSGPDHPSTELAYITQAEKNLLIKQDLHDSLKGGANRGPSGIMSLNGWGDSDGQGGSDTSGGNAGAEGGQGDGSGGYNSNDNDANPGDQDTFNPETGYQGTGGITIGDINEVPGNEFNLNDEVALVTQPPAAPPAFDNLYDEVALVPQPPEVPIDPGFIEAIEEIEEITPTLQGDYDIYGNKINDFVGDTIFGPSQKYTGDSSLFGGANKYGYTDQYTDPTKTNFGDTKPGYGGKILGGLLGLATGIPFIGGAIGNTYDKGKGFFSTQPQDMSKYNNLGLYTERPQFTGKYGTPTLQGDYDIYGNKINELTGEILDRVTGEVIDIIPGYPEDPDGGITTIPIEDDRSDQYVDLIDQYVPDDPTIPNNAFDFESRFLQNRTKEEREAIEKDIQERFKDFGLEDMDGS